jgi:hypothetical protein
MIFKLMTAKIWLQHRVGYICLYVYECTSEFFRRTSKNGDRNGEANECKKRRLQSYF